MPKPPVLSIALGIWLLGCGSEPAERTRAAEEVAPHRGAVTGRLQSEDGLHLHYEVVGSGSQVVLVPQHLRLREAFGARPELVDGRTLVFYDPRNRGLSDPVDDLSTLSMIRDLDDLEAVRRHLGAERVSVVGSSYLGKMIVLYALRHPDRVDRLVQLGPSPRDPAEVYPPHLSASDRREAMGPDAMAELQRLRLSGAVDSDPEGYCRSEWAILRRVLVANPTLAPRLQDPCDSEREWPVNLRRHFESLSVANRGIVPSVESFAPLAAPVLTIHGTRDRHAPYGGGRDWAHDLPEARLLTIDGAAHATWIDAPERLFPAIATFLDGSWPETAEIVERPDPLVGPDDEV